MSKMFNREVHKASATSVKGQAYLLDMLKNSGNKLGDVYSKPSKWKVEAFNNVLECVSKELPHIDPESVFIIRACKTTFTAAFVESWYSSEEKRKVSRLVVIAPKYVTIIPFNEADVLAAVSNQYGYELMERANGFMSTRDYVDFCHSIGVSTYTADVIIEQYNRTAAGLE